MDIAIGVGVVLLASCLATLFNDHVPVGKYIDEEQPEHSAGLQTAKVRAFD
jgi:hypothetical protein